MSNPVGGGAWAWWGAGGVLNVYGNVLCVGLELNLLLTLFKDVVYCR